MEANESDQHSGNYEDVQREESGQGRAADDGSAQHQVYNRGTDNRHPAGDRGSDSQTPVCVLIETHDLTSECHAESHQQQKDSDDPGQLAGKFVGSEQKYLRHMKMDDCHNELRAPSSNGKDEPAKRQL